MKRKSDGSTVRMFAELAPGIVYSAARGGDYVCIEYIGPGEARLQSVASGVSFRASGLVIKGTDLIAWDSITDIDYEEGEIV